MSEQKEISKAIRMDAKTAKLYEDVMEEYREGGERQGDTFNRILTIVHLKKAIQSNPIVADRINKIEITIDSVINQIIGIVSAQEDEIQRMNDVALSYKKERDDAIEKVNNAEAELAECLRREDELIGKNELLSKTNNIMQTQLEQLEEASPDRLRELEREVASLKASLEARKDSSEYFEQIMNAINEE